VTDSPPKCETIVLKSSLVSHLSSVSREIAIYQASFLFDQRVSHLSIRRRCFASYSTTQTLDTINKWHYAVGDCVTIDVLRRQSCRIHSLLINLFIKNFSPTSPAKYCFCPWMFSRLQEGFWQGGKGELERRTFCPINGEPGRSLSSLKIEAGYFGFMCFSFVNTVEPPVATTSRKRPVFQNTKSLQVKSLYLEPLVNDHLS